MLALTRMRNETLILTHCESGQTATIHIVRIGPGSVRVGIDAAKSEFGIVRGELVHEPVQCVLQEC